MRQQSPDSHARESMFYLNCQDPLVQGLHGMKLILSMISYLSHLELIIVLDSES